MNPNVAVGGEVARLRTDRKMRQDDLAAALEIHQAHLSRLERGHYRWTVEMVYAAAKALKVTPAKLLPTLESRS